MDQQSDASEKHHFIVLLYLPFMLSTQAFLEAKHTCTKCWAIYVDVNITYYGNEQCLCLVSSSCVTEEDGRTPASSSSRHTEGWVADLKSFQVYHVQYVKNRRLGDLSLT